MLLERMQLLDLLLQLTALGQLPVEALLRVRQLQHQSGRVCRADQHRPEPRQWWKVLQMNWTRSVSQNEPV
jgi:hypothetical protein